jgi:lysophospholipase L1-like esterase
LACGDEVSSSPGDGGGGQTTSSSSGVGGSGVGGSGAGGPITAGECFADHHWIIAPDYDQFSPVVGSHCKGTDHQDISGVEKLVFLGDSITQGTPPTSSLQYYRTVLSESLGQKFPGLVVEECAENGAKVGDLLGGGQQILDCFPDVEPLRTLVVITMGGNDIADWASNKLSQAEATAAADVVAGDMRAAIEWFYADPARFPAGVFVVFANVYEYTDGTADLDSCPGAQFIGLTGSYLEGATAISHLQEQYMKIAADTGSDMIFLLESFCGHGYHRDDPNGTCYLGPDAELWFDLTCIHPNPTGHAELAGLFQAVVDE